MISPRTPKSSSTPSSSRAFCCSAPWSMVASLRFCFGGSLRGVSGGSSNSAGERGVACSLFEPGGGAGARGGRGDDGLRLTHGRKKLLLDGFGESVVEFRVL